jgi:hypothetical protein
VVGFGGVVLIGDLAMGIVSVTDELKAIEAEKLKIMLDKFAGAAMQSLMQHWLHLDENGFTENEFLAKGDYRHGEFCSIAGGATVLGWGSDYPHSSEGVTYADQLAELSYFIASKMLKKRSEYHDFIDEVSDAKATEKAESAANQSGRGNDGSTVLGVPAVEPAAGESQVGSDQQACAECLQETKPER